MNSITSIDFIVLSPLLALCIGALVLLLFSALFPKRTPVAQLTLVIVCTALLLTTCAMDNAVSQPVFAGLVYADMFSAFVQFILLAGLLICIFLGISKIEAEGIDRPAEYYALLLMSTAGAIVFVSAAELITLFLGLEIMSMGIYCLCGASIMKARSAESAMKYFLLGSFSSAFLLYGMAFLYGLTGSTEIELVKAGLANADTMMLSCAIGLVFVGIIFKIGLVPFHFWAPDVYDGAPTPVTAYMACVVKAAAVVTAMRVFWTLLSDYISIWSGALWLVAVLTMFIGNVIALRQRSIKRMLAYSSIAHAGYIAMALLVPETGGPAILYYLIVYTLMTMGAFGIVLLVSSYFDNQNTADDITRFNGFAYKNPLLAFIMTVFMLSLAGIPPAMGGMLGKFYIFNAAISSGYVGLAVVGVLCAAIACYYYLRVIVAMYFIEPDSEAPVISLDIGITGILLLCAIGVVLCGIFPSILYNQATFIMGTF